MGHIQHLFFESLVKMDHFQKEPPLNLKGDHWVKGIGNPALYPTKSGHWPVAGSSAKFFGCKFCEGALGFSATQSQEHFALGKCDLGHGPLDRVNQLMFQKRLTQKRNAICIECLPMQGLISKAGHENNRKLGPAVLQMIPHFNS